MPVAVVVPMHKRMVALVNDPKNELWLERSFFAFLSIFSINT